MAAPNWTLKVDLDGDVRRVKHWPVGEQEPTFEALRSCVGELFGLAPMESLRITYCDDEEDMCTLTETTLDDAMSLAMESRILRFNLSRGAELPKEGTADDLFTEVPSLASFETLPEDPEFMMQGPEVRQEDLSRSETTPEQAWSERADGSLTGNILGSRPRLSAGFTFFKQQVSDDFWSGREDMRGAFKLTPENSVNQCEALKQIGSVTAAATGIVVAARLAPLRATRLAASSIAAAADIGSPEVGPPCQQDIPVSEAASGQDCLPLASTQSRMLRIRSSPFGDDYLMASDMVIEAGFKRQAFLAPLLHTHRTIPGAQKSLFEFVGAGEEEFRIRNTQFGDYLMALPGGQAFFAPLQDAGHQFSEQTSQFTFERTQGEAVRIKSVQFGTYLSVADSLFGGYAKRKTFFARQGDETSCFLIEKAAVPTVPSGQDSHIAAPVTDESGDSPGAVSKEWSHFLGQVTGDFNTARGEIKATFASLGGVAAEQPAATSGSSTEAGEPQRPCATQNLKDAVSDVASLVAGITITSTLLPLRAIRLAVGSAAAWANSPLAGASQAGTTADVTRPLEQEDDTQPSEELGQSEGASSSVR